VRARIFVGRARVSHLLYVTPVGAFESARGSWNMRKPAKKRGGFEETPWSPMTNSGEISTGGSEGRRLSSPPPLVPASMDSGQSLAMAPVDSCLIVGGESGQALNFADIKDEEVDARMVADGKALPSFNKLITGRGSSSGGEGGDSQTGEEGEDNDHHLVEDDEDVHHDTDREVQEGEDQHRRCLVTDKVYADLDAVPTSTAAAAYAAAAAAAAAGYPFPSVAYGSYYDGRGSGPPPPPDYGSYHGPPPGAGLYDPSGAEHQQMYAPPVPPPASSTATIPTFRYAGEIVPQPAHQGSSHHALLAAPAPAVASPQASAVAAAAGATLILPPDPTVGPGANDHCILIQRVPQRHRKNRGGELKVMEIKVSAKKLTFSP